MKSRTIAIAGSIAALAFASAPVAAIAATTGPEKPAGELRIDRSRDASGDHHLDRSKADGSRDVRDR